jgi:hypothetical protein
MNPARLTPVLGLLLLAACATEPSGPAPPPASVYESPSATTFQASDFAWSTATGSGTILGTMAYHDGAVRYTCEGGDVLLTPETAWSRRRMVILYGSAVSAAVPVAIVRARTPSAPSGDYARFVRRTTCDSTGHFTFAGLPDGAWFAITVVKPVGDPRGEAIAVTRRVETHGGPKSITIG